VGEQRVLPPIVRALLRPEAYPHPADDLQLHETHISWVILAGPYAYKLRKPVDLGFVSFTNLAARAEDCANEVRLNRRFSPDVYLGVVQVTERDGEYRVCGPMVATVLEPGLCHPEPAVWMRRLPAEGMLPAMLARDAVTPALMDEIARQLAVFHATAATGPGVDEYGSLRTVRANWAENLSQTRPFIGRTIPRETYDGIERSITGFLVDRRALFERRVADGRIREGHGDLHAASICVEDGRVILFDCLEFTPRFRCSDVAAEVAFLAMDLDHYGRPKLAAAFVDQYVRASGDTDLLSLLDFYRCYRAYVRGKVISLRLDANQLSPEEQSRLEADARAYFDLALTYARQHSPVPA
jgi:uncharacterized protein